MLSNVTGIVLVGGLSRRMGRDKALLTLNNERLVDRAVAVMGATCGGVLVIGGDPARRPIPDLKALQLPDQRPNCGALGGVYTGLCVSPTPAVLVLPVDLPLMAPGFLIELAHHLSDADGVVAHSRAGLQPLVAAYAQTCRPAIELCLNAGELKMVTFFKRVKIRTIETWSLPTWAEREEIFTNVNTPDDAEQVQQILAGQQ